MKPDRGYRKANLPAEAKRVFEGTIFDVYQWEQQLYDGSSATFERLTRPDTVLVFPVLEDGRLLMIEDTQPERDTILTVPSGRIEEGEMPEEAATRELLEETGYSVASLDPFFTERPLSKVDWIIYGFIGRGAWKVQEPTPDAGEKITPRLVTFDEFLSLVPKSKSLFHDLGVILYEAMQDPQKMKELKMKFLG